MDRKLLKATEVAKVFGIGNSTLWRLLSAGKVPQPVRIGGATRWLSNEIDAWIAAGCPPISRWETMKKGTAR